VLLQNASKTDISNFENNQAFINSLAKLESFEWIDESATVPESAMALVGEMKILVPLAGIIDKVAELARLDKDIAKHEDNIEKGNAKLNNKGFTDKAPAAVVDKERQRVAELVKTLEQLKEQAEKIKAL
jgi:valyl-tRNA synthetase